MKNKLMMMKGAKAKPAKGAPKKNPFAAMRGKAKVAPKK